MLNQWKCAFSGLALVIGTFCVSVSAINPPRVSGTFESSMRAYDLKEEIGTQVENRLRTDIQSEITPGISFAGDVIFQVFQGMNSLELADYLPDRFSIYAPFLPPVQFEDRIVLDNAYVSFSGRWVDLRVGRQPISYGVAYLSNPLDLINVKQIFDPTYEMPGVDAVRTVVYYRGSGSLEATALPGETLKDWSFITRAAERILGLDASILYGFIKDTLEIVPEVHRIAGGTCVGSILGLGFWCEGAYHSLEISRDFTNIAAGLDYTLSSGLYLRGEYHYDDRGKLDKKEYDLSDWLRNLTQGGGLGRDRFFGGFSYPVTNTWKAALYGIMNINDASFALNPWIYWFVREDVELDITTSFSWGEKDSEFGEFPRAGFLRLRVYY